MMRINLAKRISSNLERAGLFAVIHGECLQSGVGEIAPFGLLKVLVNDEL